MSARRFALSAFAALAVGDFTGIALKNARRFQALERIGLRDRETDPPVAPGHQHHAAHARRAHFAPAHPRRADGAAAAGGEPCEFPD